VGATGSAALQQRVVGNIVFSCFLQITGNDANLAWRLALIFPALLSLSTANVLFLSFGEAFARWETMRKLNRARSNDEERAATSFDPGALWI
jgi:hypothetical protein